MISRWQCHFFVRMRSRCELRKYGKFLNKSRELLHRIPLQGCLVSFLHRKIRSDTGDTPKPRTCEIEPNCVLVSSNRYFPWCRHSSIVRSIVRSQARFRIQQKKWSEKNNVTCGSVFMALSRIVRCTTWTCTLNNAVRSVTVRTYKPITRYRTHNQQN